MSNENLWGELPVAESIKPPVTILREQASLLSRMTNGILEAKVDNRSVGGVFHFDLDIHAPAINNYIYTVLQVTYGISMYPVTVISNSHARQYVCQNEAEFIADLKEVLSSKEVHSTIGRLLSLSKAEAS